MLKRHYDKLRNVIITKPLEIILREIVVTDKFTSEWKTRKTLSRLPKNCQVRILKTVVQFSYFQYIVKFLRE